MSWMVIYSAIAVATALGAFVCADWFRQKNIAAADHPGITAVVVGLLWPVVAVGAAQVALVMALARGQRGSVPPPVAMEMPVPR